MHTEQPSSNWKRCKGSKKSEYTKGHVLHMTAFAVKFTGKESGVGTEEVQLFLKLVMEYIPFECRNYEVTQYGSQLHLLCLPF
jgi:hypothetical protein